MCMFRVCACMNLCLSIFESVNCCMCTCVHVYVCLGMYTCVHVSVCELVCTCVFVLCVCLRVFSVCARVCTCVYVCVLMPVLFYVWKCPFTRTGTIPSPSAPGEVHVSSIKLSEIGGDSVGGWGDNAGSLGVKPVIGTVAVSILFRTRADVSCFVCVRHFIAGVFLYARFHCFVGVCAPLYRWCVCVGAIVSMVCVCARASVWLVCVCVCIDVQYATRVCYCARMYVFNVILVV